MLLGHLGEDVVRASPPQPRCWRSLPIILSLTAEAEPAGDVVRDAVQYGSIEAAAASQTTSWVNSLQRQTNDLLQLARAAHCPDALAVMAWSLVGACSQPQSYGVNELAEVV